jgi:hypothetical protein
MNELRRFGLICAPAVIAVQALAGVVMTGVSHDLGDGDKTDFTILVDDSRLRLNMKGPDVDGALIMLVNGQEYQLLFVDNKKKEYRVWDRETMQKMQASVSKALSQLEEQMKKMTPEQKAMMEKMLGKKGFPQAPPPPQTSYRKTGQGSSAGRPCIKYEAIREGQKVAELCAARPEALSLGPAEVAMFDRLTALFQDLGTTLSKVNLLNSSQMGFATKEIEGVPVEQTGYEEGKPAWKYELKDSSRKTFTDSDFSPGDARKIVTEWPAGQ